MVWDEKKMVRDTPLCHYCEIDLLLQATRSPKVWRWPERLDEGSISSYKQHWFPVTLTYSHLCTVTSCVYSGDLLSAYSCGIRNLSAMEYGVRPFLM